MGTHIKQIIQLQGPSWHGHSGIHTHMTNTRITDAEILERRYPVILRHFSLRPNSGGSGCFRGGDGVVRELLFRRHIMLSVLTERRVFHPYGLNGKLANSSGSCHDYTQGTMYEV